MNFDELKPLSLGAAQFGGLYGSIEQVKINQIIKIALDSGFVNLIDTSPWYCTSEERVGIALQESGISRSSYFLATKCGRYPNAQKMFEFSPVKMQQSINESLRLLKTDYIDIFYLHDVEYGDLDLLVTQSIPQLIKLKEKGVIRLAGICGYPLDVLDKIIDCSTGIDIVQSHCHLTLQNTKLVEYAKKWSAMGIKVMTAAPLAMGLLTASGPQTWHPASSELRQKCRDFARESKIDISKLAIAYSYQLARQSGCISSVVVGPKSHMEWNTTMEAIKLQNDEVHEVAEKFQHMLDKYFNINF